MRYAIDACVSAQLAEALTALGADVISAAGRPAMPDEEVLSGALAKDRVLLTTDKDFGELVFRHGQAAVGIVLIRFNLVSDAIVADTAKRIMALPDAGRDAFTVLDQDGERARQMPTR